MRAQRSGSRPDGEQVEDHLVGQAPQLGAVVDRGEGVVVDDAVDRLVLVLQRDVVHLGAEVVAEVRRAGGLDPAEDPLALSMRSAARGASRVWLMGRVSVLARGGDDPRAARG